MCITSTPYLRDVLPLDDPRWTTLYACYEEIHGQLQELFNSPGLLTRTTGGPSQWDMLMASLFHLRELSPALVAAFPYLVQAIGAVQAKERGEYLADLADAAAQAVLSGGESWWLQIPLDVREAYEAALRALSPIAQEAVVAGAHRQSGERSEEVFAALLSLQAFAQGEQRLGAILARWYPYSESRTDMPAQPLWALTQYEAMTGDVRPYPR